MGNENRAVGKQGENTAARFLARKGYRIIERNVETFMGEIDIVAREGRDLVFAEIKARTSTAFGPPYLAVTREKQKRLIRTALCYLKMKCIEEGPWRIDVISVEFDTSGRNVLKVEHFEDAVCE